VLAEDEARRIASNIAQPVLLSAADNLELDFPEGGG
jgi:hypothetical protein